MPCRRVYLVRHGETLYQGVRSARGARFDLTERGVEQTRALAELFRDVEVDRIVASPLARSFDTASLLAMLEKRDADRSLTREQRKERAKQAAGLEVTVDDDLREITAGSYDGKSGHEIFSEVLEFFSSPTTGWDTPYLGGETYRQLRIRAQRFLERMIRDSSWTTLVAVAHGGINNALLSVVLGKDESSGLLNVEQDFGCVNAIDHDGQRFSLRLLNFTCYDPLKSGLKVPSIELLAELVRGQLGVAKDETR